MQLRTSTTHNVLLLFAVVWAFLFFCEAFSLSDKLARSPSAQTNTAIIYDSSTGTLQSGFEDWSWGDVNFQNTQATWNGSNYAISFVVKDWEGLYLHGPSPFSLSIYQTLSFRLYGSSPGAQPLDIYALSVRRNQFPTRKIDQATHLSVLSKWFYKDFVFKLTFTGFHKNWRCIVNYFPGRSSAFNNLGGGTFLCSIFLFLVVLSIQ